MSYYFLKKKNVYACHYFLSNLDILELLGVFTAIYHLNECLVFCMLFYMCRSCFLKFFVIKFHSKIFFLKKNCFVMLHFLITC